MAAVIPTRFVVRQWLATARNGKEIDRVNVELELSHANGERSGETADVGPVVKEHKADAVQVSRVVLVPVRSGRAGGFNFRPMQNARS